MNFIRFRENFQKNFAEMTENATHLFEIDVDKDELWNLYLDSFPAGTNEFYRKRREYDCSCCRHFIKTIGNVVVIDDYRIKTVWDFETGSDTFNTVAKALSTYIKSHVVTNVYVGKLAKIGVKENFESLENGSIHKWEHLYMELPHKFVDVSNRSVGDIQGDYRDTKNVFKRSLDEISIESIEMVLEIIAQNSLYKGEEWKAVLSQFLHLKKEYDELPDNLKDNYTWVMSTRVGSVVGRIRNHSIGTLLVNLSEGMDLDTAVRKYEQIVAPSNYKRPKSIYTKKMLEAAKVTIEKLGYMDSLERRYAILDDITINNILFANRDSVNRMSSNDIFDEMINEVPMDSKKFSRIEEVTIDSFVNNILPTAKDIEVFFENRHAINMVSLIAPKHRDSKTMFKWNNGFSWAYSGNITDSSMKENVKAAGGKIDGDLRFSIQWNDEDYNPNDFDAHCLEPTGTEIYFGNRGFRHHSSGMLDVDIINPVIGNAAVENIVWSDKTRMPHGTYKMVVHCYSNRGGRSGFKAEIEFDGQIHTFTYNKALRQNEFIRVADVMWDGVNFTIKDLIPSSVSSREVWNLTTNRFIPVSIVCYSPNYWDEQCGIGNKHYLFMLKNCINPEHPNGFYNEFLKQELVQHKRVFEALGGKMAVEDSNDQLSGLGFSSTRRNDLIVKVKGNTERIIKIKF